jgi:hypothetical protein
MCRWAHGHVVTSGRWIGRDGIHAAKRDQRRTVAGARKSHRSTFGRVWQSVVRGCGRSNAQPRRAGVDWRRVSGQGGKAVLGSPWVAGDEERLRGKREEFSHPWPCVAAVGDGGGQRTCGAASLSISGRDAGAAVEGCRHQCRWAGAAAPYWACSGRPARHGGHAVGALRGR